MPINLNNINWQDIIIPFASAFAGAFFAYKFNACSENKKHDEENFKRFNLLLNQVNVAWIALMNYKIVYLSEIEKLIDKDNQKAVKKTILPPDVIFKANIEENIFLAKYNFQFLSLLSEIEKQSILTQKMLNVCQLQFSENNNWIKLPYEQIKSGIGTFETTKNFVDKILSYLLLLREKLLECKNRYFRFLYSDERDIYMNHCFDYLIPDINQFQEIVNFSKIMEQSWVKQPCLLGCLKLYKDKIFFKFSSFLNFIGINHK